MGHSISEVVETFDIHQSAVSCVYLEYLIEGIPAYHRLLTGQPRVFDDSDQKCLGRIVSSNRQVTLIQIMFTFNAKDTRCISSKSVQQFFVFMGNESRRPTRVILLALQHQTLCFI